MTELCQVKESVVCTEHRCQRMYAAGCLHLAVNDLRSDRASGLYQAPQRQRRNAQRVQVRVGAEHLLQEL